jgi:D-arginine dehydrogenase
MDQISTDIAVIGAGIAGAGIAAAIGDRARVVLIESEDQPGYHSTGRSAAFWSESYGGPQVQPLTTASGPWLAARGLLSPRGCLHLAESRAALDPMIAELEQGGVAWERVEGEALATRIPGLRSDFAYAVSEPTCQDIDVGTLHALLLKQARIGGTSIRCRAPVQAMERSGGAWVLTLPDAVIRANRVVNAAGAWASAVGEQAGATAIAIQPFRRTIVQVEVAPPPAADLPLLMDALGRFYARPEAGGRLWVSPHDETAVDPHDVAPEEWDQALALHQLEQTVNWRVIRRERAWAGLRSFAPDRLPVYGFDSGAPGFFWCAGQGGFGIQTAPAASALAAALLLDVSPPEPFAHIDMSRYSPGRFRP